MLLKNIEEKLNLQVKLEADSSQFYLSMASYAETIGFNGVAQFMYLHSEEERQHMLKLIRFINERGGKAIISEIQKPQGSFDGIKSMFEMFLQHEIEITNNINKISEIALQEKDYITNHFLQWYIQEQMEEESLVRTILDKLNLIGDEKGTLYLFDRDIISIRNSNTTNK